MIIDYIKNAEQYIKVFSLAAEAFAFAQGCTADMADGRYDMTKGMYASVMSGETTPIEEDLFETHNKYIDLQYMIEGEEFMETADLSTLELSIPYDEQNDISFYKGAGQRLSIRKGMFYILFPNDAHKSRLHVEQPTRYKKVIVKIPV